MAWSLGEEFKVRLGTECINNAVAEIDRKYGGDIEWPEPGLRKEWKEAIAAVSDKDKVQLEWYQAEVRAKATGRRAAYCRVREAELRAELAATHGRRLTPIQTARHLIDTIPLSPAPFAKLSLRPLEISIITRMRCHMLSCIRTHCGHQAHVLRRTKYPPIAHWHLRTCVFCAGSCLDDNVHFFLRCPFHADARAVLLHAIHTAIIQAGANFQWTDYDMFPALQAHVLLGVGGATTALREAGDGLLTKIVGAAARFVLRASRERLNAV